MQWVSSTHSYVLDHADVCADHSPKRGSLSLLLVPLPSSPFPARWTIVVRNASRNQYDSVFNPFSLLKDHWHDVTVGSILGLTVAYFSYRQYYPHLASELSHRPYSPRIKSETAEPLLPVHRYDPLAGDRGYDSLELEGTVRRPGPQHLRDAWRDHDNFDVGEHRPARQNQSPERSDTHH